MDVYASHAFLLRHARPSLILSACLVLLTGCATRPAPPPASAPNHPAAAQPAGAPVAPAAAAPAGSPPAFEQVSKGAERQDGLLPLWRRQDKVWLELSPSALGKPLFLSPKLSRGIGEAGVFGGLMHSRSAQVGRPQWVEFRKVQQQVQLLAINAAYTAREGSPQALAVAAGYSPSLLASAPIASAPHPQSGAVLIELNALMLGDVLGLAQHLQRQYRQSYALDPRHTVLLQARTEAQAAVFEVSQHFATSGISAGSTTPGMPGSSVPATVPDPRSLFVNVHYTLSPLPAQPMPRRPADPRVGYFSTSVIDFSDDLRRTPRERFINRWRLDKKDPAAAVSEPVQPIVFWLDPSIPEAYRGTITEGVLEWNKAFEAIGLRNAIEVRTPPADTPFDTLETGRASIRWMTNHQPSFGAIGPSHVDPRTGEILDADIAIESLSSRAIRTARSQFLIGRPGLGEMQDAVSAHPDHCDHAEHAAEQLGLALDVLAARGELDPDSPDVQRFVLAYLKDTTMHEVGHALGLRHNFKASRWRTAEEMAHPTLGAREGNSASVMEYAPINLPMPGQPMPAPFQTTLGPYDYWAIEYGYKPLAGDAARVSSELRAIAARSAEPAWRDALAYGTDEDQFIGLDPHAQTFDLGRDPVVFARQRIAIVRDLFERQARRTPKVGDDPALARRAVAYGLRELGRTGQILMRQVGGLITRRDDPASQRDLLVPLPASEQRAALRLLLDELLAPDAVRLPPALLRRLTPDFLDRQDQTDLAPVQTDFSLAEQQMTLQRQLLDGLMADTLAERLLDNADKVRDVERKPLTVSELHRSLRHAIWHAPAPRREDSLRRNLQREHVNRLAQAVVRSGRRADVRAVMRDEARNLVRSLKAAPGGDAVTAAHRRDCIETLQRALDAGVVRTAP